MNPDFRRDILDEFLKRLDSEGIPETLSKKLQNIRDGEEIVTCEKIIPMIQECTPEIDHH